MWAEQQPGVTAVADENETLSYQQLNQRANQLARLLIQQGVQPGQPVAIHLPGSVPAIIAILACHKARAPYVPFDPAYPNQRLQFMLDDTGAPVILTDSPLDNLDTGSCAVLTGRRSSQSWPGRPTPTWRWPMRPATRRTSSTPLAPPASPRASYAAIVA